ncbi:MAG: type IV secretion system DNA-binding domain-containing protein, partial [Acidimicrobiales bacterium]
MTVRTVVAFLVVVGAALAAAMGRLVWAWQQEQDREAFRLLFPRDVKADQIAAFFAALSGRRGDTFTLEVARSVEGIVHRLMAPAGCADFVAHQLRAAIPGVRLLPDDAALGCGQAVELRLTDHGVPLRVDEPAATSTAVLAALAHTPGAVVQWTITPKRRVPLLTAGRQGRSLEARIADALVDLLRRRRSVASAEELRRLTKKAETPLFRAALRVGIAGGVRESFEPVASALNSVRAPGVDLRRRLLPADVALRRLRARRAPAFVWSLLVNGAELTAMVGWPIDSPLIPGLHLGSTPHLPPTAALPDGGLVLGTANFPGQERTVAINHEDALRHLYVAGPTGVGKSTLGLNLVVQQMAAGFGVVVIDPKGDLVEDLLERIPTRREAEVVLVDPTDSRPVGLNLLDGPEDETDLTADQVVGVFGRRFGSSWGPRTDDIARASVLTLLGDPQSTLADLPALLSAPQFRRHLVGKITDPALAEFWQTYESWSDAERA